MLVYTEYMTSSDVCKYCGFSTSLLNSLEKSGHLKPRRKLLTNGKRLYLQEDVDAFLESIKTKNKN